MNFKAADYCKNLCFEVMQFYDYAGVLHFWNQKAKQIFNNIENKMF